ncbi:DUF421 domain-containing protein [Anaeromicrobium sediminis]|uniref:DUF421 domain-containing protein n=1 Tax=Anaeromicrobium sediminis TaxID=1478221 RepID=A0A267MMI7_9FIRM|nr:DUF421 domain-containing protein [Anaeromicrobium sediminis]PAB60821.1 hypothetical protein CCE28_04615 [Anaeromicrobium sediminis]
MTIYFTIAFRVVTIMLILLISTLIISGRRTLDQLPVFDFLTIIVIGAITGADIAEPKVHHFHITFAIVMTYLLQKFLNIMHLKSITFRRLTTFPPIILVQDGKMIYKNIKSVKYTIDEVLMLLRQKDIFNISEVRYAILEPNGEISILRKNSVQTLSNEDITHSMEDVNLSYTIILEGKLQDRNLGVIGISKEETLELIQKEGFNDYKEIFFASMDKKKNIYISPYNFEWDHI